jgi:hypothetical protein
VGDESRDAQSPRIGIDHRAANNAHGRQKI